METTGATRSRLSAAQPQPNDLGRGKGVPSKLGALSRRAERGDFVAHAGRCEWDQRMNSSKAKVSNHTLICDFRADYQISYSKGRTVVTALLAAREADTDKLSQLAV